MERNEILAVAIDAIRGNIEDKFSEKRTSESIVNALVELNGGSTKIKLKDFRPGNPVFELVQEMIPTIIDEGIKAEENPLFDYVDYRNIADGDEAAFEAEAGANFVVATAAAGIRDVRRQRIVDNGMVNVPTEVKIVRVYENLGRLLAGRIDFQKFVDGVAKAFLTYINQMIYDTIDGMTSATYGLSDTYVKSGTYVDAKFVTLIEHVEAATGKSAMILGTKAALNKIGVTYTGEAALTDKYEMGYYGRVHGTPCFAMKQSHKPGTETFALNDNKIVIIAGDDKFIKFVNEGEGLMIASDATERADLTRELGYVFLHRLARLHSNVLE